MTCKTFFRAPALFSKTLQNTAFRDAHPPDCGQSPSEVLVVSHQNDAPIRRQLRVRSASLATLCLAVFVPILAPVAGIVLAVEFGWLFANLLRVVRARRDAAKAAVPRPGSHAST